MDYYSPPLAIFRCLPEGAPAYPRDFCEVSYRCDDRLFIWLRLFDEAMFVRSLWSKLILVGSEYRLSIVGFSFGVQTKELLRFSLESLVRWRALFGSRIFRIFLMIEREGFAVS